MMGIVRIVRKDEDANVRMGGEGNSMNALDVQKAHPMLAFHHECAEEEKKKYSARLALDSVK